MKFLGIMLGGFGLIGSSLIGGMMGLLMGFIIGPVKLFQFLNGNKEDKESTNYVEYY